jgi:6-phosphogluconolactonase (cycloisomerase 2 family)
MNTYSIKSVADLDALVEKMTEPCSEQGPINTNDINVYVHYYGDDSPGEQGTSPAGFSVYMAWSEAKEKVLARLSTEDVKAFHATIDSFQKNTKAGADNAANRKVLSEYYKKILACTEDEKKALAEAKLKQNLQSGTRVRVGKDKGSIVMVLDGGVSYAVILDKAKEANPHCHYTQGFTKGDFVPLCDVCDDDDGKFNCSKCKMVRKVAPVTCLTL